jgi:hypothetical protein
MATHDGKDGSRAFRNAAILKDVKTTDVTSQITHLSFPTRYLVASTFLRFEEFYESPEFKDRIFSLEEFMDWYAAQKEEFAYCRDWAEFERSSCQRQKGNFTYYMDWSGFNIPSYVLKPFYEGKFDPLSKKEQEFLELFSDRQGEFYIIGTSAEAEPERRALPHEIAHGLWATDKSYKKAVRTILQHTDTRSLEPFLTKAGYHPRVHEDEKQANIIGVNHNRERLLARGVAVETVAQLQQAHDAIAQEYNTRVPPQYQVPAYYLLPKAGLK